eukprot:CAMPEP_0205857328 /NCGR_PEP_ID=MMETSP1083-20121108/3601_1 /ASSEMBLY_ACC=CAM_ASM_000430 /TAXON_ID=97485 /ORGANISM="Prymnesium parvum, Strain Texoma1" /LENGTH=131 /DNA_ID=CAMNT_0053218805 /DNA_START=244 /DNA_END=640 /DNA_ORIENTATION=+
MTNDLHRVVLGGDASECELSAGHMTRGVCATFSCASSNSSSGSDSSGRCCSVGVIADPVGKDVSFPEMTFERIVMIAVAPPLCGWRRGSSASMALQFQLHQVVPFHSGPRKTSCPESAQTSESNGQVLDIL